MGGDFIGSDLVRLTTGFDFVEAVLNVSLGKKPDFSALGERTNAAVRFIMKQEDLPYYQLALDDPEIRIIDHDIDLDHFADDVTDSSNRHGYYIITCDDPEKIRGFMDRSIT